MNFKKLAMALTLSASFGLMVACDDESSPAAPKQTEDPASSSSVIGSSETITGSSESNEDVSSSSEANAEDPTSSSSLNPKDILDAAADHLNSCEIDNSNENVIVMTTVVDGVSSVTKMFVEDNVFITETTVGEGVDQAKIDEVCAEAKAKAEKENANATVTCEGNVVTSKVEDSSGMAFAMVKMMAPMMCGGNASNLGDLFSGNGEGGLFGQQ